MKLLIFVMLSVFLKISYASTAEMLAVTAPGITPADDKISGSKLTPAKVTFVSTNLASSRARVSDYLDEREKADFRYLAERYPYYVSQGCDNVVNAEEERTQRIASMKNFAAERVHLYSFPSVIPQKRTLGSPLPSEFPKEEFDNPLLF